MFSTILSKPCVREWIAVGTAVLASSVLLPSGARATINDTLDAGYLRNTPVAVTARTPLNQGALLLLVDVGAATPTLPTAVQSGNFNNFGTIIDAFSINNGGFGGTSTSTVGNGAGQETLNGDASAPYTTASDNIEIFWFPTITYSTYHTDSANGTTGSLLTAGTAFGAYNPLLYASNAGNDAPDGGDKWVVPSNSGTVQYLFITSDDGGTQPESEGEADFAVVPEPSTYAVMGFAVLGLAGMKLRQRRVRRS